MRSLATTIATLLLAVPAVSQPPQLQGPCQTGCEATYHLGIQETTTLLAPGQGVTVSVNTQSGSCALILGEDGPDCIYSGCETFVDYIVFGMGPDEEIQECHGRSLPLVRDDCLSPPPLTDANGNSFNVDAWNLACGSGEHIWRISCQGVTATVKTNCEACDQ